MENREIVERFASRLENAIDREELSTVSSDVDLICAVAIATLTIEEVVNDLRSAANTQEGE